MDRCRPDRGIARQYTAARKKATGPYFHPPDLPHRGAGRRLAASQFRAHGLAGFFSFSAWLAVIAEAAVLLLACHLLTRQSGRFGGFTRRWDIQLADTMKRAMARQAEAELEKRAKIINAEGESLAAATASGTAMS